MELQTINSLDYAGKYLKTYKPSINIHSIINGLFTRPAHLFTALIIAQEVQFPDISFWQGEIDFEVMRTKTKAIILRAGQGLYKDEQFDRNYAEARRVGMVVGIYWFYDDRIDPRKQAETLIRIVGGKTLEMGIFIDWENSYGGQFKGLADVVAMMQLLEGYGYDVGTYTGYFWFRENSNPITNAGQYAYLKNKPLWLAWYTNNPSDVLIPAPWLQLTHWQWGTPVVAWGQKSKEIDMNFFNGTEKEFSDKYGIGEPSTGGTMQYKITPDTSLGSKIRSDHVAGVSNQIGSLAYGKYGFGSVRWGDGQLEDWIQINKYENPQGGETFLSGWIASRSNGVKVATITEIPDAPPPSTPAITHTIVVFDNGEISLDGGSPF